MKKTAQTIYLALLRGINVGGKNIIPMKALKDCFENMGFSDITTFIQSGNVLFKTKENNRVKLITKIEKALSESFNYKSVIVLIDQIQLEKVVKQAPVNFGSNPDEFRYDVFFIKEPLTPAEALPSFKAKEGVDKVFQGTDVIYTSKLISKAGQSYLSKIISNPVYQNMTIRNWNTTSKLFELTCSSNPRTLNLEH